MLDVSNHFYNYCKAHPGTPIIIICLEDKHKEETFFTMKKLAQKIKTTPIIITDIKDKNDMEFMEAYADKRVFSVPHSGYLSALLCVVPLQRIAYDLTIALGYDPDKPKNLAKELTTI